MKTAAFLFMAMILAGAISACGGNSPAGAAATAPPAAITGLSTPQSVSVVTAN